MYGAVTSTTVSNAMMPAASIARRLQAIYAGCYRDTLSRDLPVWTGAEMSFEVCMQSCAGYKYFGQQANRQCVCGDSYGKYGTASNCQCGTSYIGAWVSCIYEVILETANATTTTSTTTTPTTTGGGWSVQGSCSIAGRCVTSANYPSEYGNSQACTMTALEAGTLRVEAFYTELNYDFVLVGGLRYSGQQGPPQGVEIWPGQSWDVNRQGKVCSPSNREERVST
mmetsp:Transcript_84573/g.273384  ORF Transcript_84573/g.273384 Transcript_84573/m.273384 type:complete len:225 (-) Transcript_84573:21-695(-)